MQTFTSNTNSSIKLQLTRQCHRWSHKKLISLTTSVDWSKEKLFSVIWKQYGPLYYNSSFLKTEGCRQQILSGSSKDTFHRGAVFSLRVLKTPWGNTDPIVWNLWDGFLGLLDIHYSYVILPRIIAEALFGCQEGL